MKGLPFKTWLACEAERKIRHIDIKEHKLKQLFWECTLSCNLHCRHCGSDCKVLPSAMSMKAEDFLKVLDSVKAYCEKVGDDPGHILVILTGGEPLMRKDLEECGRKIIQKGFPWGMVTNGFAMTPERFRRLMASGLHSMTVSLDGLKESHDWMWGREGSYERAVGAIKLAISAGDDLAFDVVTCVNQRNYNELNQIKEMLISMGLKRWRVFTVFPSGRGKYDPMMQLDNERFRGVMKFIEDTRKEGRIKCDYACEGFLGPLEGKVRGHLFRCHAGVNVGSVLNDGSISACVSIRADYNQGNIYKDDFMEVWNNRFQVYRDRSWMKTGQCGSCKFFRYCEGGGMHLRNSDGSLQFCHLDRLK
ncbi:MAG: TIGR04133 family radical SAM/SPASM protein [Bacteroidales bacterium]|nr:TIGR04133 family radical SAM/SPASM protein [Bacteroidales bacterium]